MRGITGFWAFAAVAVLTASVGAQEVHRLSGTEVAVYNLAGKARIVAGSGADVTVRVTRGGADAERLQVEAGTVRGVATLSVRYPGDQVVYPELGRGSRATVRVRDDGTFGGGSGGRTVEVRGSGRGTEAWADLVIEVPAGKRLAVHVAVGEIGATSVRSDLTLDTGSGSVTASGVTGSLNVDTGSGSVSVTGSRGNVSVDTGSGSVMLRDVEGDEVSVDTGSGSVRGGGIRAGSLSVDTGSGSVDLDEVSVPSVSVDTGSGSVQLALLRDVDLLEVDTGSGSVTIYAPENLGAQVDLETGSGGIDMDFAVQVRSVRRDRVAGVLGDGRGTLTVETGSGGIRLLKR